MDLLRQSYKDFLVSVKDVIYEDFDNGQKLLMVRIMYKLKSWFRKPNNIDSFIGLYGNNRLYEINIIWNVHFQIFMKRRHRESLSNYNQGKTFAEDYVKYLICHDIHGIITINKVSDCVDKYKFFSDSIFFLEIASHGGADDTYYLTLLEEFGNDSYISVELYNNVNNRELFMIAMFGCIKTDLIMEFIYDICYIPTQAMVDVFASNILSNKYHVSDSDNIVRIFRYFEKHDMIIPYDELICCDSFIDMCKEDMDVAPKNICDIIAQYSCDNISFLKVMIEYEREYDSQTIKLAQKHGNMKCAKYMKKHLNKK